jgi:squalene synthase HpnD/squalene synthase HpnC
MSPQKGIHIAASKGSGDENFPVGSWLLPAKLRPYVARFYAVVRAADDIADHPSLSAEDKLSRLGAIDATLTGAEPTTDATDAKDECAVALRFLNGQANDTSTGHARDLLRAFKQDATKNRYDDWADLLGYCCYSANPVGRFLLDLHGEGEAGHAASDALCAALQIINHLQDCGEDFRDLDRVYIPLDYFTAAAIGVEALDSPRASAELRWVLDRCLDGVDELLAEARPLASLIRHSGMRREASVIVALAEALAVELRRRDPLSHRVVLTSGGKVACVVKGILRAGFEKTPSAEERAATFVAALVRRSGSSFYGAMRLLPKPKRQGMYAIYAFCRVVDDIADGPSSADAKRRDLAAWHDDIEALFEGRPCRLLTQALAGPVARFGLRREDLIEILKGVEMDTQGSLQAPSLEELELYCSRVAGAVGLLSVRVFGCGDGRVDEFALAVGAALQFTNILRDVAEDAEEGRLYLPREALDAAGITSRDPQAVAADPHLPEACAFVAAIARKRFGEAEELLAAMTVADRRCLRPAVVMMTVYRRLLERLEAGAWRDLERRVKLPRWEKMWIALRYGLL